MIFQDTWIIYLSLLSIYFCFDIGKRTHPSLGVALFFTLFSSIGVSYREILLLKPTVSDVIDWSRVSAGFTIMLVCYALSRMNRDLLKWLLVLPSIFAFSYGVTFIISPSTASRLEHSMAACFTAVTIPFLWRYLRGYWKLLIAVPVISFLLNNSDSGRLLLGLSVFLILWFELSFFRALWVFIAMLVTLTFFHLPENDASRIEAYQMFLTEFWERGNIFFGNGTGWFYGIAPFKKQLWGNFWLQPHSELLRSIIEQGLFGTILWAIPVFVALKRAYQEWEIFSASLIALVWVVIQYPLHRAYDAALVAMLFFLSLRTPKQDTIKAA
jgi:hypothetical protein